MMLGTPIFLYAFIPLVYLPYSTDTHIDNQHHLRHNPTAATAAAIYIVTKIYCAPLQTITMSNPEEVFLSAVTQCQWDRILEAIGRGVSSDQRNQAVSQAVRHCQWRLVSHLVQLGVSQQHRDLAAQTAARHKQWDCVYQLLSAGITLDTREYVLERAARHDQWALMTHLMTLGVKPKIRDRVERQLSDVITVALHTVNQDLIHRMLSVFKSTRRLLKQIFLVVKLSTVDAILLHTLMWDTEPDLTVYLLVSQEIWECFVNIYEDPRLSGRARCFALKHAIRKQAWGFVKQLACLTGTSSRDRRHAFLQAARLGEWHTALEIGSDCVSIRCSDKIFALKMWLCLGLWQCVTDILKTWGHENKLVRYILHETIIAGQLELFKEACSKEYFGNVNASFIFKTAVAHNKDVFVLEFCRSMEDADTLSAVLKLALKKHKWNLVKELIEEERNFLDPVEYEIIFQQYLRSIKHNQDAWPTVVPGLNSLCERWLLFDSDVLDFNLISPNPDCAHVCGELLEFCLEAPHVHLAVVLSVVSNNEQTVDRVVSIAHHKGVSSTEFNLLFDFATRNSHWESAVVILEYLSEEDAEYLIRANDGTIDFDELILKCREKGLFKWATYVGLWTSSWDKVRDDLKHCQDVDTVDLVVQEAAERDEWGIVLSSLSQCSQDSFVLCELLCCAVRAGNSVCCEVLIGKENPLHARSYRDSLLFMAVNSSGDREDMVKLCIKAGLSTHLQLCDRYDHFHDCDRSPMREVLYAGQLPLIKLLFRAGACSNKELFTLKNDQILRERLSSQGRHDIIEYMNWMATTPRSLQDLCRQRISHCIGCQPSRSERVSSHELPWFLRDFINFGDLLS